MASDLIPTKENIFNKCSLGDPQCPRCKDCPWNMLCSFAPMLSKLGLALLGHLIFTTFHPYRSINGYLLYFHHQSTAAIGRDPLGNIVAARTDRLPICSILWAEAMAAWSVILLAQDFLPCSAIF